MVPPAGSCFPMVPPFGSRFPKLLPSGRLLSLPALVAIPAFHGLPRRPGQSASVPPASNSFPMLPHSLPCRVSSGAATFPHRLPLRSIPPQRFACGSSHSRGHGRPRSVRKSSRLRWKGLSARLYLSTGLLLLRQMQICRPICTDCLRHLRISAG